MNLLVGVFAGEKRGGKEKKEKRKRERKVSISVYYTHISADNKMKNHKKVLLAQRSQRPGPTKQ